VKTETHSKLAEKLYEGLTIADGAPVKSSKEDVKLATNGMDASAG